MYRYIGIMYQLEAQEIAPTTTRLARAVGVSVPTARKYLNEYVEQGYMYGEEETRGNTTRIIYSLTDRGIEYWSLSRDTFLFWQTQRFLSLRGEI